MKKTGKTGEKKQKKPGKPVAPVKQKGAPDAGEAELRPYSSPPCMMGELDEIMEDEAVRRDRC